MSLGQVVYSKKGRDKGRYYLIVGIEGEFYAYIADGDLRKIEKPKKKKVKHLILSGEVIEPVNRKLSLKRKVSNAEIKQYLASFNDCGERSDKMRDS